MSVLLTKIASPLNLDISIKVDQEYVPGKKLDYYLNGQIPFNYKDITWVVSKNGLIIKTSYHQINIDDGDKIAICPQQAGSLAGIVAAYITGVTAASLTAAGIAYGAIYALTYLAVMFVVGYGMSMLAGALAPGASDPDGYDTDTTYSWGVLSQTTSEGIYIPFYYGVNKVAGHTINQFIKISSDNDDEEILYMLNALCDHELDSIDDIRINENPASYYKDCYTYTRIGTTQDALIPGFDELVTQTDIGSEITEADAVIQTTQGKCEKIDIILSAPYGFYWTNDEGGLDSRAARYTIKYRVSGTSVWTTFCEDQEWSGKTTSSIKRVIEIDNLDLDYYDIYAIRTNEPITSSRGRSDIFFASMQEILKEELTYPGLAKYAVRILATDQLSSSVPTVTCIATRSTVQVYDPYGGQWISVSAKNPAWICYDLLIQHKIPVSRIIYDEFLEWAQYCDTNIAADGEDEEKRIELNVIIQGGSVWEEVQKIANMGRAVIIRRNTKYGVFIDKPDSTVSHLFTMGNIVENSFTIQYLPQRDRASAVEIEYFDPDRDYTKQIVTIFSDSYINDTSLQQQKASIAFNATFSQKQAIREGVYRLNSNRFLVRVVTFDAFIDSFACVVGDVFEFQHESINYLKADIGGVVKAAGNNDGNGNPYVTLDRPVNLTTGYVYKIKIRLSDDSLIEKTINNDQISDFTEPIQTLPLTQSWAIIPSSDDIYAFGHADTYLKKYRITSVTKKDELTRTIIGLEYIDDIYTDNDDYVIEEQIWENKKQEATQVLANEFLVYSPDGSYVTNINVSWHRAYYITSSTWAVWFQDITAGTSIKKIGTADSCQYTITSDIVVGHQYKIYITLDSQGLVDTGYNSTTITVLGKLAPPGNVISFSGEYNSVTRAVNFNWSAVSDIDLHYYLIKEGGSWDTATKVISTVDTSASVLIGEDVNDIITYWIKAVDTSNIMSESATGCQVTIDTGTTNGTVATPEDLSVTSSASGDIVTMLATWSSNAELSTSWRYYQILIIDTATGKKSMYVTTECEYQWTVLPGKEYAIAVRAVDMNADASAWSDYVYHTAALDAVPPDAPVWASSLNIVPGFKVIGLRWDANEENDISHYLLERSTTEDFSSGDSASLGEINGTFHSDANGLEVEETYYYRLQAVDTSGNVSDYSTIVNATTLAVGSTDIAYNAILANHIYVTSLNAISANMGTITAGKIQNDDGTTYLDLDNDLMALDDALVWDGLNLTIKGSMSIEPGSTGYNNLTDSVAETNSNLLTNGDFETQTNATVSEVPGWVFGYVGEVEQNKVIATTENYWPSWGSNAKCWISNISDSSSYSYLITANLIAINTVSDYCLSAYVYQNSTGLAYFGLFLYDSEGNYVGHTFDSLTVLTDAGTKNSWARVYSTIKPTDIVSTARYARVAIFPQVGIGQTMIGRIQFIEGSRPCQWTVSTATDDADIRTGSGLINAGKVDPDSCLTIGNLVDGNYCRIDTGDIEFYQYLNGAHRLVKSLKNIDSGIGISGQWTRLNGYWAETPKVLASIHKVGIYDPNYPTQEQSIRAEVSNIRYNSDATVDIYGDIVLELSAGSFTTRLTDEDYTVDTYFVGSTFGSKTPIPGVIPYTVITPFYIPSENTGQTTINGVIWGRCVQWDFKYYSRFTGDGYVHCYYYYALARARIVFYIESVPYYSDWSSTFKVSGETETKVSLSIAIQNSEIEQIAMEIQHCGVYPTEGYDGYVGAYYDAYIGSGPGEIIEDGFTLRDDVDLAKYQIGGAIQTVSGQTLGSTSLKTGSYSYLAIA